MRFALRGIVIRSVADARRILEKPDVFVARCARNLREGVAEIGCYWARVVTTRITAIAPAADAPDTS